MINDHPPPVNEFAVNMALEMLKSSRANISGHKVGAGLLAMNEAGRVKIFGGCNIEYSVGSKSNQHAEELAMHEAVKEGYIYPLACYVTSTNTLQRAAMCGNCMQLYSYVKPDCFIYVVNLDGSIKFVTSVEERNGPYAYLGKSRL